MLAMGCFSASLFSQVIVDPGSKTSVTNSSVSLEFGDQLNKGIVLPYVTQDMVDANSAVAGTLIMDPSTKKVKIKLSNTSGDWYDLSNAAATTNSISTAIQDSKTEKTAAHVYIGSNPENNIKNGILVLGDTDKAMILPKVSSPHLNVVNPAAGMIVYDTHDKQLAVFNGTQWSFLKP